jgi:hypothetical protein
MPEITMDWANDNLPDLGAEGEDGGNGDEGDYEIPAGLQPEDIGPESQLPSRDDPKKEDKKPKKDTTDKRNPGILPGNNTDPKNPKVVMPRRNGGK